MVTEHLRSRRLHESAPEIQRRGDHAPTPRRPRPHTAARQFPGSVVTQDVTLGEPE